MKIMNFMRKGIFFTSMWIVSLGLLAQNITVTGTVIDNTGLEVIGATIIVEGDATRGTVTDIDGKYILNNVPSNGNLQFSYVGMKTNTIPVNGRTVIDLTMSPDTELLDEVVVVGYGVQKKVNVTGAVSNIDSKALQSRPVVNVAQALQGVIPGLNFSQNNSGGTLDNTMNINIRGAGTIGDGSSSSPLVLIDGVQGNLNSLNPLDIESISVLKDAASSAIYGSRAAFGVILVTTKSGKSGKTNVNFSTNIRFTDPVQIPQMMDSYRFAQYFNEAAKNDGQGAVFSAANMELIQQYQAWQRGEGPEVPGTVLNPSSNRWNLYSGSNGNTDWFAEMYRSWVPSSEYNINVNGGSDKITYMVSGSFLDQNGLIRHGKDNFNRYTINSKINATLSEWVKLNYNNKWVREEYSRPAYMTGLFFHNIARRWPTNPVFDPNGFYIEGNEVLQMREGGLDKTQRDYLNQQVQLVINPITDWNIYLEGNYNTRFDRNHWDVLPIYGHDGDGNPYAAPWSGGDAGNSSVSERAYKENFFSGNFYTNYILDLDAGHSFTFLAGMNMDLMNTNDVGGSKKDLITPFVPTINTATNDKPSLYGGYAHWSSMGYFGRVNYNFQEKYLLEANVRRDGTSRFIGDKTWGTFPSFSLGWNIAREEFFEPYTDKIGTLKLRASWGQLGNMNTNAWYPFYQNMPFSTASGNWLVNGQRPNTSGAPGIVSSLMTWERIESWNLGLDWNAFSGKLTGSFDLFNRTTKDMIGPAPELSSLLGTGVPKVNNADMESYGWELEAGWRDRINEVSYGVKLVLSDDQQRVTRYPNATYNLNNWYNGRMNGEIWGYTTVGIAKSQQEMDAHLAKVNQSQIGSNWAAGDIMYADISGDGQINSGSGTLENHGDLSIIGNSTPRYKYGVTLDAAWKGIDFRVFFQGVGKRDYSLGGPYFWGATGGMWQSTGFNEHWDFFREEGNPLGANLDSYYPRPLFDTGGKNQQTQTRYLQDASYLRVKNIQLGYTLPQDFTKKALVQSARIYVSADNLFTFSQISGVFDPELLGGDWGIG